jgi:hypothetical protein
MSIARPTALIRRAVALPIGLLDRIEASLDAAPGCWVRPGRCALDRRISAVADRTLFNFARSSPLGQIHSIAHWISE